MLEIDCAGEKLQLLPEKAVYWPGEKMLIVADLHLGKPAAFRQAGIGVPESTTAADLSRLNALLEITHARRLIILGDLFHSKPGLQQEMLDAVTEWRSQKTQLEIILISGNHDKHSGAPPKIWGLHEHGDIWRHGPFIFSHQPDVESAGRGYILAGHIHPAIVLRESFGGSLRAPCFCFGPRRAILPAFGSFTGMHNLKRQRGDRIFAINAREREIVELPPDSKKRTHAPNH